MFGGIAAGAAAGASQESTGNKQPRRQQTTQISHPSASNRPAREDFLVSHKPYGASPIRNEVTQPQPAASLRFRSDVFVDQPYPSYQDNKNPPVKLPEGFEVPSHSNIPPEENSISDRDSRNFTEVSSEFVSRASEDVEEIETMLESCLKELLIACHSLSPWRARLFLRLFAGSAIPFRMIDVTLLSAAYLSLTPQEHHRFAQLQLNTPITVARIIITSKILNAYFLTVLLTAIALLCIETDPLLTSQNYIPLFVVEAFCMINFVIEIVLQRICIHTSLFRSFWEAFPGFPDRMHRLSTLLYALTVSEGKAHRIMTGQQTTPSYSFLARRSTSDDQYPNDNFSTNVAASENGNNALLHSKLKHLDYLESDFSRWLWLTLDVVATLPFFIEAAVYVPQSSNFTDFVGRFYSWSGAPDGIRAFRLLRILRLVKVGQKSGHIRIIWKAILHSVEGIRLLLALFPLFVVFFSFLLFYAEHSVGYVSDGVWYNADGKISSFQSILDAFWCITQTLTTVGYGDISPVTPAGKVVNSVVMILSLFVIAFPLCIITLQYSHFARVFSDQNKNHLESAKQLRARLAQADENILYHPTTASATPFGMTSGNSDTASPHQMAELMRKFSHDVIGNSMDTLRSFRQKRISGDPLPIPIFGDYPSGMKIDASDATASSSSMHRKSGSVLLKDVTNFSPDATPHASDMTYKELMKSRSSSSLSGDEEGIVFGSLSLDGGNLRDGAESKKRRVDKPKRSQTFQAVSPNALPMKPRMKRSSSVVSIRDVERHVSVALGEGITPGTVLFKVMDWKLDYNQQRREDVLTLRVKCKKEEDFRKLMKVLSDFN